MNVNTSGGISRLLSAAGLLWCVGMSVWIWVTPIRSSGLSTQAWSSSESAGTVSSGVRTVPAEESRRFADVSRFGALPLVVPVFLAALAAWGAWRNKRLALVLGTMALLGFCVLAGFSIGSGYLIGGGAMLWAFLVRFAAEPEKEHSVRDLLEIIPYDPAWVEAFAAERGRLWDTLGDLAVRIEHHGSTAVPGLAAKPIIDIQISVRTLHPIDLSVRPLAELGYVHRPHPDDAFAPFFYRPAGWRHSHHIHVVEAGGDEERKTLAFRDYLREHPDVAQKYELLKRELAPKFSAMTFETRQAYADAKGEFIVRVTRQALADGHPKDTV